MINNKVNLCFSKKAAGILLAATSFLVMACSENVKELSTLSTNELGITIPDGQSREYSYTDQPLQRDSRQAWSPGSPLRHEP